MSRFKPASRLELKTVQTFIYGGQTSTFKRHQEQNLERIEELCKQKVTVSERYKEHGYLLRLKKQRNKFPQDEHQSPYELQKDYGGTFYPWQCISLFRPNMNTLDLQIEDYKVMMALINVIYRQVNKPSDNSFMKLYRQLKFKMKLAYEAWSREVAIGTLLHYAVLKTLQQKLCDTSRLLKQMIWDRRFNIQHRLLSASDESSEAVLKVPDQKRLKQ